MYDNFQFIVYNTKYDTAEVTIAANFSLVIPCFAYNATVVIEYASDIVYLYRLAEELPFTNANLAIQKYGLMYYVDATTSLNLTTTGFSRW